LWCELCGCHARACGVRYERVEDDVSNGEGDVHRIDRVNGSTGVENAPRQRALRAIDTQDHCDARQAGHGRRAVRQPVRGPHRSKQLRRKRSRLRERGGVTGDRGVILRRAMERCAGQNIATSPRVQIVNCISGTHIRGHMHMYMWPDGHGRGPDTCDRFGGGLAAKRTLGGESSVDSAEVSKSDRWSDSKRAQSCPCAGRERRGREETAPRYCVRAAETGGKGRRIKWQREWQRERVVSVCG
jgi:hypothetical protein